MKQIETFHKSIAMRSAGSVELQPDGVGTTMEYEYQDPESFLEKQRKEGTPMCSLDTTDPPIILSEQDIESEDGNTQKRTSGRLKSAKLNQSSEHHSGEAHLSSDYMR